MAVIVNGRKLADSVLDSVAEDVIGINGDVGLAVVLVGDNKASATYVSSKIRDCNRCGIKSFDYTLPEDTSQDELLSLIEELNDNNSIDGILVQMPLPKQIDEDVISAAISPAKDVDGFHPENMGRLMRGVDGLRPCTPSGIMVMLDEYGVDLDGKNAVIVGRSTIVGKPMSLMLLERNATVTIAHSHTNEKKLIKLCRSADVLIVACGVAKMVKSGWVKDGATVIDVGIDRDKDGKLCGDVDFDSVSNVAGAITPVPGGVGLMTRAMLMRNVVIAAKMRRGVC